MAVKSLYFKNTAPTGASTSRALQDGGTAPTAAITTTGWTVARLTSPNLSAMVAGTERASGTFTTADALGAFAAAACWRTENPITGTFANANWTLAFRVRAVSSATAQTGQGKGRIWKSDSADGPGATQLTRAGLSGTTTAALSTSASATSTVTWTPGGTVALSNEYLWVQCEWSIVATATNNAADVLFYVESAGVITTSNFVLSYAMPADTAAIAVAAQPATLRRSLILHCDTGAVVASGNAATLTFGRSFKLSAATGTVAVSGVDAALQHRRAYRMPSAAAAVVLTGVDATLTHRRVFALLAAPGEIVVTGSPAELTHTVSDADPVLTAEPAAIAVSTASADLSRTYAEVPPHVSQMVFGRPARMTMFRW